MLFVLTLLLVVAMVIPPDQGRESISAPLDRRIVAGRAERWPVPVGGGIEREKTKGKVLED